MYRLDAVSRRDVQLGYTVKTRGGIRRLDAQSDLTRDVQVGGTVRIELLQETVVKQRKSGGHRSLIAL
jgi:hypothetical protein